MTCKTLLAVALALVPLSGMAADTREDLQPSGRFSVYGHGAAATPPMGWNPWNAFRTEVTQDKILAVAETIKRNGMQQAGYRYINIDDGWWLQRRADGGIQIRTRMFPMAASRSGPPSLRPWTDHLHAMGFKAGLYTDVGRNACSQAHDAHSPNLPVGTTAQREIGLEGFEASDLATMFGEWGFDYIKVDACGLADFGEGSKALASATYREGRPLIVRADAQATDADKVEGAYARVGRLLAQVNPDNDFVLSICPWGEAGVGNWGGRHGNLWRTSPDIEMTWESMLHNFDTASRRELYAGPGRWNDPDMLAVGLGEFGADHMTEARTHFSMWAILAAPLLVGFDLNHATPAQVALLSNPEVIALNQDPAGNQGRIVASDGPLQVLVKPLSKPGERGMLLLNRGDTAVDARVTPAQMLLSDTAPVRARDLWQQRDLSASADGLGFSLPPHGAVLLKVVGTPDVREGISLGEITGRIHVAVDGLPGYSARPAEVSGTPRVDRTPQGGPLRIAGTPYARGIGILANSRLEVQASRDYSRFTALAGVDDSARAAAGTVVFKVYGDGRPLFTSAPLGRGQAPARIEVKLDGVQVLELVAEAASVGEGGATPVVAWAEATLQ
ncbi:MAG: NPCBM/NEW2 domain-containing protein [Stenotrophomonas sp.]|nr:NPCBM/NEW2 domain-containing protein [Stenotrophomonas sp.]